MSTMSVNLDECILCQKIIRSEYPSSGETGKACIVTLANEDGGVVIFKLKEF